MRHPRAVVAHDTVIPGRRHRQAKRGELAGTKRNAAQGEFLDDFRNKRSRLAGEQPGFLRGTSTPTVD